MISSINKYGVTTADTKAWDTTQQTLKCCGIYNSSDWQQQQQQQQPHLPESCQRSSIPVNVSFLSESEYYNDGCAEKVASKLVDDLFIVIGGATKYRVSQKNAPKILLIPTTWGHFFWDTLYVCKSVSSW